MSQLTDTQREVLAAVCDTIVPAIPIVPDRDGLFARKASDLWVPQVTEYVLPGIPDDQRASLIALLEALVGQNFQGSLPRSREQILHEISPSAQTRRGRSKRSAR